MSGVEIHVTDEEAEMLIQRYPPIRRDSRNLVDSYRVLCGLAARIEAAMPQKFAPGDVVYSPEGRAERSSFMTVLAVHEFPDSSASVWCLSKNGQATMTFKSENLKHGERP